MGCDIHVITEIRKNGAWAYVPELPNSLCDRNYKIFAALAGVRDDFGNQVFEEKGLPKDISGMKFRFDSEMDFIRKRYDEGEDIFLVVPDPNGEQYKDAYDSPVVEISNQEFDLISAKIKSEDSAVCLRFFSPYWSESGQDRVRKYYVHDAWTTGGAFVKMKFTEVYPTVDDFAKAKYHDEWDETAQDYGHWDIDFGCGDFHTPSWLTLSELQNADYSVYKAAKYKMDRDFYEAFKKYGGTMPDGFSVIEEPIATDFFTVIRESVYPMVTILFPNDSVDWSQNDLFKGIEELRQIAEQYNVDPDDIRIVFAFDN